MEAVRTGDWWIVCALFSSFVLPPFGPLPVDQNTFFSPRLTEIINTSFMAHSVYVWGHDNPSAPWSLDQTQFSCCKQHGFHFRLSPQKITYVLCTILYTHNNTYIYKHPLEYNVKMLWFELECWWGGCSCCTNNWTIDVTDWFQFQIQ